MHPGKLQVAHAPLFIDQMSPNFTALFTRLPYDVRAIIYSHLVPEGLPPLVPHFPTSLLGFVGSCRQAKQEMEELASNQLQRFLTRFKTDTSITATITRDTKNGPMKRVGNPTSSTAYTHYSLNTLTSYASTLTQAPRSNHQVTPPPPKNANSTHLYTTSSAPSQL
jgi:hypothetical protein